MGRPPLGKRPMTAAERQAPFMERLRWEAETAGIIDAAVERLLRSSDKSPATELALTDSAIRKIRAETKRFVARVAKDIPGGALFLKSTLSSPERVSWLREAVDEHMARVANCGVLG